jgi:hypothetical protein
MEAHPNWVPLERRLERAKSVGFMFMGRVNGINRYKHGITRASLHLDGEGNCCLLGGWGTDAPGIGTPSWAHRRLTWLTCLHSDRL